VGGREGGDVKKITVGNLKERKHLEDLGVDERIILQ
jgi:hypothetical protein